MPIAAAGLYKVTVFQRLASGNPYLNVFWYLNQNLSNDVAEELYLAFDASVLQSMQQIQNVTITYDNMVVQPIFGTGLEVSRAPLTTNGNLPGASALTGIIAAPFRYNRSTNETRSGWKRFAGQTEVELNGNTWEATYVTACDAAAVVFGSTIVNGGESFDPVIVRKPGVYASGTEVNYIFNPVASVSFINRVTSQTSRKQF